MNTALKPLVAYKFKSKTNEGFTANSTVWVYGDCCIIRQRCLTREAWEDADKLKTFKGCLRKFRDVYLIERVFSIKHDTLQHIAYMNRIVLLHNGIKSDPNPTF